MKYTIIMLIACLSLISCTNNDLPDYARSQQHRSGGVVEVNGAQISSQQETFDAYHNGMRHLLGQGVPVDYSRAYRWFKRAADDNNPYAENEIGYMYLSGKGLEQNPQAAFNWFKRSADHGLASAQYTLGVMYTNGLGVNADPAVAATYFKQAAAQGFDPAKRAL